jgi:hypothetical protein
VPNMFPIGLLLTWGNAVLFYFLLFWAWLPMALLALEFNEYTKRYA